MIYSEETLRKFIDGRPSGKDYPYNNGTSKQIEFHIKSIVADLERSNLIKVEADFKSYGSGYSSYIDIFCYKKDGSSTIKKKDVLWIDGITIYISKLAPVAIYGASNKTKHSKGGGYNFLDANNINSIPKGNWDDVLYTITNKLKKYEIEMLRKRELAKPLDFKAKIPTILNDGGYKIFDAIFYWED
ncbi:MAG: hypothetical protein H7Y18_01430 [Clostridiaceae bacterium]|nr:hypothetical protein [Clostridiaceae bacterium]